MRDTVRSKPMAMRIFKYFIVFTVVIMIILWLLQILFLQAFYQQMKIRQLYSTAKKIETNYGRESLTSILDNLTVSSDMYIQIENSSGVLYVTSSDNPGDRMNSFASRYDSEMLKERLDRSGKKKLVLKKQVYRTGQAEAMIYASVLDVSNGEKTYMFIYTPLTAVTSTVVILSNMLIIVTLLAIVFGVVLSIIIARRLARPVNDITNSAAELAKGRYEVNFNGAGCAETEELAATLNYAAEELSKADKLQKDLLANVSHDLKTPLTMVRSYAEMIRDLSGSDPEKRTRHLNVIIAEADRLNDLVNDLTILSKMQAHVDDVQLQQTDLLKLAQTSMDSFSLHREKEGFSLSIEAVGSDFTVEADSHKIGQVFANLIGNAIRYSSDDKYVQIRITDLQEDGVRCEIIDHGQGISEEDQAAIWDRYYQSSRNHSRNQKGSGLGLSIVKQIFIMHDAVYGLDSKEGEGSNFWFELKRTM